MARSGSRASSVEIPTITQADLLAFHRAHFSDPCLEHFSEHFLGPGETDDDDDGLGYYPDGVKRTLTDEQIMMFRHSEVQALLRERQRAHEAGEQITSQTDADDSRPTDGEQEVSDIEDDFQETSILSETPFQEQPAKRRRKKGKQNKRIQRQNSKPDLRKRTWDKVEMGLGSLDYGEEDQSLSSKAEPVPQRRRIAYDDS